MPPGRAAPVDTPKLFVKKMVKNTKLAKQMRHLCNTSRIGFQNSDITTPCAHVSIIMPHLYRNGTPIGGTRNRKWTNVRRRAAHDADPYSDDDGDEEMSGPAMTSSSAARSQRSRDSRAQRRFHTDGSGCRHIRTHTHARTRTHTHAHPRTESRTDTRTHVHTHTHTHARTRA